MRDLARRLLLCLLVWVALLYVTSSSFAQNGQEYIDETGQYAIKEAPIETSEEKEKPIWIEDLKTPNFNVDKNNVKGCVDEAPAGSPQLQQSEPRLSPPNKQENLFNQQTIEDLVLFQMPDNQIDYAISACLPANYSWMTVPPGHEYLTQRPLYKMGMLLFNTPEGTSRCTASVVGERLVLTAGHCVSDGAGNFYNTFRFYPATQVTNPLDPSRAWSYETAVTFSVYLKTGAWCRDVALLVMQKKKQ
jgi:hypothetical protein